MSSRLLNLKFNVEFLSDTLVGEADVSSELCKICNLADENICGKSVILTRNIFLKRVLRASNFRGVIRASAEYIVEALSLSSFNRNAICSYLRDSKNINFRFSCKIPFKEEDKKILELYKWIKIDESEGNIIYKNYPCLVCSFFGTAGLRSLIQVTFVNSNDNKIFEQEIDNEFIGKKCYLFSHQTEGGKKLFLEFIKKGGKGKIHVSIRDPLVKSFYVKSSFKVFQVGVALIWLSFLPINGGVIRFGRFGSRGFGHLKITATYESLNDIAEILNTKNDFYAITDKSLNIIIEELRKRLY